MKIKTIVDEVFQDFYKISMLIGTCYCDFKCLREIGEDICICQNSDIFNSPTIEIDNKKIIERFNQNNLTEAIIFGGLEPISQFDEIKEFISEFRKTNNNDILIYTGYYPEEINKEIKSLEKFNNIYFKFGRFIPNKPSKYDEILKINLSSDNQFGMKIA